MSTPTELRAAIIDEIWSGDGFPTAGWTSTVADVASPLSSDSTNLSQVDSYVMTMNDGGSPPEKTINGHVFWPTTANGNLVVYNTGHSGSTVAGQYELINALIDEGYVVALTHMPDAGGSAITLHNAYTATASLNYLRFFVECPIRLMNQLDETNYTRICMSGISGGGWITHMVSAIDTRIHRSAPVAGSLPLLYRADSDSTRDWEQWLPRLFPSLCDYHDLYVLACQPNRRQLHILNTGDTTVFPLHRFHERELDYTRPTMAKAQEYGGSYELYWDLNNEHTISANARSKIVTFFGAA